ncbi:hypothetical protein [Sphingosinicella rhizophila]|uniref:Uncharacterized protein n=1 Tax=Sphingosinicella rhizophila TaxID=3050082 RepID=A0ABU3QB46_9SPHN|nr:hypothetical protein [Sphingosinicella sp. GR2756]MDT9600238.1 hypothetical protein [Sphingosinicella sp. GR2756]
MMHWIERMLTRRHDQHRFTDLKPLVRRRLKLAARELRDAEDAMAAELRLPQPPRLLMIDEEEAVIVLPNDRANDL